MKIYVDADACPSAVRDLVIATAKRKQIQVVFVSNKPLGLVTSQLVRHQMVSQGADVADGVIVESAQAGDLVITQDIPLAHILVSKGVAAISPYGTIFDSRNIADKLSIRDTMQFFREAGMVSGGPKPFDANTKRQFANALDKVLTKLFR